MARILVAAVVTVLLASASASASSEQADETAVDVARQVYADCLQQGSMACVRPRVLAFLAEAKKRDGVIRITRDLSVVPSGGQDSLETNALDAADEGAADGAARHEALRRLLLERVDRFLQGHDLLVAVPRELTAGELASFVPRAVVDALPREIRLPLDPEREDGASSARHRKRRGFLRKVVLPFILGLKFKTTVLIPLALALIALKTWKALTLGLLSLVLSGAMVIFRFTKPKVVNYDVYHYPQHHGHYEHHVDHGHYDAYDHHARSDLAYSAHQP